MANFISEDQIERATIDVFVHNLGYRHVNCLDKDISGCTRETDVFINGIPVISLN